jgi:hypothetical protein
LSSTTSPLFNLRSWRRWDAMVLVILGAVGLFGAGASKTKIL